MSKKDSKNERQYDNWPENNMDVVIPNVNVNNDDKYNNYKNIINDIKGYIVNP